GGLELHAVRRPRRGRGGGERRARAAGAAPHRRGRLPQPVHPPGDALLRAVGRPADHRGGGGGGGAGPTTQPSRRGGRGTGPTTAAITAGWTGCGWRRGPRRRWRGRRGPA